MTNLIHYNTQNSYCFWLADMLVLELVCYCIVGLYKNRVNQLPKLLNRCKDNTILFRNKYCLRDLCNMELMKLGQDLM